MGWNGEAPAPESELPAAMLEERSPPSPVFVASTGGVATPPRSLAWAAEDTPSAPAAAPTPEPLSPVAASRQAAWVAARAEEEAAQAQDKSPQFAIVSP